MKQIIIAIIFLTVTMALATSDPNTPIVPPRPGVESISVVDNETLRITTSKDVKKSVLIARRKRLVQERNQIDEQIAIIDAKLANFK